jgi:hypothetical protein
MAICISFRTVRHWLQLELGIMKADVLLSIEKQLPLLSHDEQLALIEQLAHHLRKPRVNGIRPMLVAIANDPQIQEELRQIEAEFSVATEDGLEDV